MICLPGMGADSRLFSHLKVDNARIECVEYLPPKDNESLSDYCQRLAERISPGPDDIYLGVSLGGVMAQELASLVRPSLVILISSLTASRQINQGLRWLNQPLARKLTTGKITRSGLRLTGLLNGVKRREDAELLEQMALDADPGFLRWSMAALVDWQAPQLACDQVHLHGTDDRVIPYKRVSTTHTIDGGSHFMILDRAEEISNIIQNTLKKTT